jgi:hypothetical protein
MRNETSGGERENSSLGWEDKGWVDQELEGAYFQDVRLGKRLRTLLGLMSNGIGQSIPLACQDWANTKAAYRFFSNDRITEEEILSGHFSSTEHRARAIEETLLVLHDTTEFSYYTDNPNLDRLTGVPFPARDPHRFRGFLMHSSLALTTDGLPLGLTAIKFWTRKSFKGTNALKRKINPTRIPIQEKESFRWLENLRQSTALLNKPSACVHIGDRESDIYELFAVAHGLGTNFLVRTCVDRLAGDGEKTVAALMAGARVEGVHQIEVRRPDGTSEKVKLTIKYEQMLVRPPEGKKDSYPPLDLTIIHAVETSKPKGRKPIIWKLITNLPVDSLSEALEKIEWYALRWKIEVFHKILKSGCRAEDSKLRSTERLTRLVAVFCILSWRVFWMTMIQRVSPAESAEVVFTPLEIELLEKVTGQRGSKSAAETNLGECLAKVARLGGYLARASDPPPGNMIMWRGLSRLTDIHLGYLLAKGDVGN